MAPAHCIEEFQVDITFSSKAQARREQARLQQWLGEQLLPALDKLFTVQVPGQRLLRFERLEFDFGRLSGRDYQQQITQQLVEKLTALLSARRLEIPSAGTVLLQLVSSDIEHKALEQLILFLRTGQLPWYDFEKNNNKPNYEYSGYNSEELGDVTTINKTHATAERQHQDLLTALLGYAKLPEALRAIPEREQLLERLANQFSEKQLSALLHKFIPQIFAELSLIWALFNHALNKQLLFGSSTTFKKYYWKNLLRLWLAGDYQIQDHATVIDIARSQGWPAKFLQGFARDVNIASAVLYKQLRLASQQLATQPMGTFSQYIHSDYIVSSEAWPISQLPWLKGKRDDEQLIEKGQTGAQGFFDENRQIEALPSTRDLRHQLAQIFNKARGDVLELLWPKLLVHHSVLLRDALTHYLAIHDIRQKALLLFSFNLLGDIFLFLKPEWDFASLYKSLTRLLAPTSDIAIEFERDLWEVSFNFQIHSPSLTRVQFLSKLLAEFSYRQGLNVAMVGAQLVQLDGRLLDDNELKQLVSVLGSSTFFPPDDQSSPIHHSSALAEPLPLFRGKKERLDISMSDLQTRGEAHPFVVTLQSELGRSLENDERQSLEQLLALVLDEGALGNLPISNVPLLSVTLRQLELLPGAILGKILIQFAQQWFDKTSSIVAEPDWQLLVKYSLRYTNSLDIASNTVLLSIINNQQSLKALLQSDDDIAPQDGATIYRQLFQDLISGQFAKHKRYRKLHEAISQHRKLQKKSTSEQELNFADKMLLDNQAPRAIEENLVASEIPLFDAATTVAVVKEHSDIRWQEFLRKLQSGHIALVDLHLNDNSGKQIVEYYLTHTNHIAPIYHADLLASISAMSRRALDTADYYRRILHCLIYHQPLDFEEITSSKNFWQAREKPAMLREMLAISKSNPASSDKAQLSHQNSQEKLLPIDSSFTEADEQFGSNSPAFSSALERSLALDYEQQLWMLLNKIKNMTQPLFSLSLTQLQQLVEFYVAHAPELASQFRVNLRTAITNQANSVEHQSQRYNYYANLLRRLLVSAEIDVEDPHLLEPVSWVRLPVAEAVVGSDVHAVAISQTAKINVTENVIFSQKKLIELSEQLQTGAVQLDEIYLSETQWRELVDAQITKHQNLNAAQKDLLINQVLIDNTGAERNIESIQQLLRQLLQSRLIELPTEPFWASQHQSHAPNSLLTSSEPVAINNAPDQLAAYWDSSYQPLPLEKFLTLAEAINVQAPDESEQRHLLHWGERIASGELSIAQLPMSLPQLTSLVKFFITKRSGLAPNYQDQIQKTASEFLVHESDLHRYYLGVLQTLLTGTEFDLQAIAVDAELSMSISDQLHNASKSYVYQRDIDKKLSSRSPSLAELLALLKTPAAIASNENRLTHLLYLGELITNKKLVISQLQLSLSQLTGLTNFFIANSVWISADYRDQLQIAAQKFSNHVSDKRQYFFRVLDALLAGGELDLEAIARSTDAYFQDKAAAARHLSQLQGSDQQPANSQLVSKDKALTDKAHADSTHTDRNHTDRNHTDKAHTDKTPTDLRATAQAADSAVVELDITEAKKDAVEERLPNIHDEKSLVELLWLSSINIAQSTRLQQLLQEQLNRGRADAIRLWFNSDLADEQLLRLIALLPDYALHQLVRISYAAIYELVYPLVKHVLNAFSIAAPEKSLAHLHQEKWLFILQQCLRAGSSKPEQQKLLVFARQLSKAAGINDSSMIEKLVQERFAISTDEMKSAQEVAQDNIATEALLTEALHEGIHINNAGQVLAAPYFGRLFAMLQLTDQGQFVSLAAKDRAAHLLEYMVTGNSGVPEYELLLNKVLCGIGTSIPISAGIEVTEQEKTIIEQLLNSIIQHWKVLGSTSIDGLRETFLRRQGWLYLDEDGWRLRVQPGTFDMLLDQLPWSISLIKSGWMDQPLKVSWRE